MDKFVTDQAEGLRRLLARDGPRVIAVTGGAGAPGRTTTVANLAAALTAVGRRVLVIDECGGRRSVAALAGGASAPGFDRFGWVDWIDAVMRNERSVVDAIERYAPGFGVLAAPRARTARYPGAALRRLLDGYADIVLIDAQLDEQGALSPLALHAQDLLLVTRIDAHAITATYACIKRLHFAHAIGQFRVLANYVHSEADAQVVLDNLVGVASHYLSVALERAGCIAADPHMPRAVELARCIVDAFPSTVAARDYRRIAADLPHWPLRPALTAPGASFAGRVDALWGGDGFDGMAARLSHDGLQHALEVSTETSIAAAEPAGAGWQTGSQAQRRPTHHA